ncbi:MAG: hypothetical protein R3B90_10855 [Planctomycetaceae bacterium]
MLSETVRRYAESKTTVVLITFIASWATLLTPFLTTLNNHVPAAISVIFALDAATRITISGERRWWWFAWCGFVTAFAVTNELPAAAFGLAVFWMLFRTDRQLTLSCFLPAAFIPITAFFVTNGIVTGGIRPFYMFYGTDKYVYTHEGIPSYWVDPKGIDRARESTLTYLFHCTVGHHGLLSLTPVYLFSLLGWLFAGHSEHKLRDYLWLGAGLTALVLAYFLTRTENYNYGGNTVALRWMLWLVPLWLVAMIPPLDSLGSGMLARWGGFVCLLLSVFSAWYPLGDPWQSPWLMTLMQNRGWVDYRDPAPKLAHATHSWIYTLPSGPPDPDYWVQLESIDSEGVTSTLLVKDGGPRLVNGREIRVVRIYLRNGAGKSSELTLMIDVEQFRAGEPIDRWVLWNGDPGENARRLTARFLSGLPTATPFEPIQRVYRRAAIRRDAFECTEAGAAVLQPAPSAEWSDRLFKARIVVSEEVPFGILKLETFVFDKSGSTLHAHRRWAIHKAGKFLPRPGATPPAEPAPSNTTGP